MFSSDIPVKNKKCFRRWGVSALVAFLLFFLPGNSFSVFASEQGKLTLVMQDVDTAQPVGGGSFLCYRIADTFVQNNQITYQYVEALRGSDPDLTSMGQEEVMTSERAKEYLKLAEQNGLEAIPIQIPASGVVTISEMSPGLYVLRQEQAAQGYETVPSFCVSLPYQKNGVLYYSVTSYPKAAKTKGEVPVTPTPVPTPSPTPDGNKPKENTPSVTELPYTGLLQWPIPVLAILGMSLFLAGWRRMKHHETDERQ